MRAFKYTLPFLAFIILFTISCQKSEEEKIEKIPEQRTINGVIQKGPFVQGSEVRIQILNEKFLPSGIVYFSETQDDFGSFEIEINASLPYLDIATTGFYFNEITGELSSAPISLKLLSESRNNGKVNVNILTTLEFDRIEYLINSEGSSFSDARIKAEKEILAIFKIDLEKLDDIDLVSFEELDISTDNVNNGILLAISSILQFENSEAELFEMVKKISADIKEDGILNNENIKSEIINNSLELDINNIKQYIITRYHSLGIDIQVSNFEVFIDHDGNGIIDFLQATAPIILPEPVMTQYEPVLISMSNEKNHPIYYTLDGSIPTTQSTLYTEEFYIGLDGINTTVNAISYTDDLLPSSLVTNTYYFAYQQAFSVKFNNPSDTYNHDILLELYSETDDTRIFYTTDGSTPDSNSLQYSESIRITGDGTNFNIKAKAFHKHLLDSKVSQSYYYIDYQYNPDSYQETLNIEDYNNALIGEWIGHSDSPWVGNYTISLEISENGHYSAQSLSGYKYPYGDEVWYPAFYYGTDEDSDNKVITLDNINANHEATGEITIYFDPDSRTDELRHVRFSNDLNHLTFEFWHLYQYGPVYYHLTRIK